MSDICGDNRFELIKKYKQMLIENTNIEMAKDEMAVIDNILFRFWQMNWLDKLEQLPPAQPERQKGKWIYGESEAGNDGYYCSKCGHFVPWKYDEYDIDFIKEFLFCNKCGADMRGEQDE